MIDDDTAINLSAMFFRIRTTAAYQEGGEGGGLNGLIERNCLTIMKESD